MTTEIALETRTLRVVRPAEPDRMLDDGRVADLNRLDDYMPYWAYLWPGAFLLARAVDLAESLPEAAIEIGSGLGLAGLAALGRGVRVHFTDYDPAPFAFIGRSIVASGLDPSLATFGTLDWREPASESYPLILGADILYEARLIPLVADVVAAMLAPGGSAWIADPYRAAAERFPNELAARGLSRTVEAIEADGHELGRVRGTLQKVRRGRADAENGDGPPPRS